MNIIITGANGQLGRCLQDELNEHAISFIALSSSDCDISSISAIRTRLSSNSKALVINCAAYTSVDLAENESETAYAINAFGVKNIAEACKEFDCPLIHISTDYVFDGSASKPYTPESPTNPIGVYGASKLQGEQFVLDILPSAYIIRTSWVFSEYGNNFVKTMLRLANDLKELDVVADQVGKPTYARDLAKAIRYIYEYMCEGQPIVGGIYHFANGPQTSWSEFAREIFRQALEMGAITHEMNVTDIMSSDYPSKVVRPAFSTLDTSAISACFGVVPDAWQLVLVKMMYKMNI